MDPFFYITIFTIVFLGLCFGSFATAMVYRLPRDISMVTKGHSSCPSCGHNLGCKDLVPLFSWLFQRGKCRYCKAPIGWRYPLVELTTLALCLGFYARFGFCYPTFVFLALAPVIVSIVAIDLEHKIIPDGLNLTLLILGLVIIGVAYFADTEGLIEHAKEALGGIIAYGVGSWLLRFTFMHIMKREPMGLGDVKFFAAAGAWLGLSPSVAAHFMMVAGGAGVALALIWRKVAKEAEFPFGPALVLAFVTFLFLEPQEWWICKESIYSFFSNGG